MAPGDKIALVKNHGAKPFSLLNHQYYVLGEMQLWLIIHVCHGQSVGLGTEGVGTAKVQEFHIFTDPNLMPF